MAHSVRWEVEQRELGRIGCLKEGGPFVKMSTADGCTVPRWLRVPGLDAPPKFVHWRIEEVQFDTDANGTSYGSHLVTLDSRREPEVKDNAKAQAHNLLGELPEFLIHLRLGRRGPRGGAESPKPIILREAYGVPVRRQLPRKCGLARPGQSTRENQSSLAHVPQSSRPRAQACMPAGGFDRAAMWPENAPCFET